MDIGGAPTDLFLGPSGYKAFREIGREQARIYDPKCTGESWMGMTVHKIEDDEIHIGTTSRIFVKQ